ncbi:MAG: MotA/TolQ/ExbB proton channel family protein [Pirellulales bacterium]
MCKDRRRIAICRIAALCISAAALGLWVPRPLCAQTPESAAPPAATSAAAAVTAAPDGAPSMSYKNLFQMAKDGGPMMIPLFVCSFITMVFVFERAISLRRGRIIPRPFVKRFLHQVREGKLDRDGALELCYENGSPMATVFAYAAKKWGRPSVELEQAIIDAGDRVSGPLRRYVRLFNAVSTVSPLMGLLGTVLGMIRLFESISKADAMGRTELLAGGISEAMLTTATGLLIAIPALCFYVLFASKVERLLMEIDEHAQELVSMISAEALQEERQAKLRGKSRPPAAA